MGSINSIEHTQALACTSRVESTMNKSHTHRQIAGFFSAFAVVVILPLCGESQILRAVIQGIAIFVVHDAIRPLAVGNCKYYGRSFYWSTINFYDPVVLSIATGAFASSLQTEQSWVPLRRYAPNAFSGFCIYTQPIRSETKEEIAAAAHLAASPAPVWPNSSRRRSSTRCLISS